MKKLIVLSLLLLISVNGMQAQQKLSLSLVNPRISGSFYLYDLNATIGAGQTWSVGLSNIRVNFTSTPANALTVKPDNPVLNANPNISNANGYFPMSTTSLAGGEAIALNILTFNSYGFYVFTEGTYLIGTLRWNIVTTPLTGADMYFRSTPSQFPSIVFDSLSQLALTTGDVTLNNPLNNSAGQLVNLTFKWFKATDKVLRASGVLLKSGFNTPENINAGIIRNNYGPNEISNYRFELATDTSFINIVISDSSLTDTVKSVTSLSNLTNYYKISYIAFKPYKLLLAGKIKGRERMAGIQQCMEVHNNNCFAGGSLIIYAR
ncbi:MAG: hypothetical protein NTV87_13160 [Ignavibacteriae bacterium]|nr:hypothetical protein [Ignavibacteriota bacterium]